MTPTSSNGQVTAFPFALATELSQPLYTYYTPSGLVGFAQASLASISVDGTYDDTQTLVGRLVQEKKLVENVVSIRMDKNGAGVVTGNGQVAGGISVSVGVGGTAETEVEGNYGAFVLGGIEAESIVGGRDGLGWTDVQSSLYW